MTTSLMFPLHLIDGAVLRCPFCSGEYHHLDGHIRIEPGNDRYDADWSGRGDVIRIPFKGECGHCWQLCIGFHKGHQRIFPQAAIHEPSV